jgi:hypothetical protein
MLSVASEDVVGPVIFPVKVKPPELALLIVLDVSTLIAREELNAEEPVNVKVPPFKLMTLLVLPRLAVVATDKVPADIVELPLYVFVAERTHVPEPTLIKFEFPVPLPRIWLKVLLAVVPAKVKVLVESPV